MNPRQQRCESEENLRSSTQREQQDTVKQIKSYMEQAEEAKKTETSSAPTISPSKPICSRLSWLDTEKGKPQPHF